MTWNMEKTYRGAIGLKIVMATTVDVSGATLVRLKYKKPSGAAGYWGGMVETPTSVSYTTVSEYDLDEAGVWEIQAYVEKGGYKLHGRFDELDVEEPLMFIDLDVSVAESIAVGENAITV